MMAHMMTSSNARVPTLSIVIPVCNEAENIAPLLDRLHATLATIGESCEIVFVDDGSRDGTADTITSEARHNPAVRLVQLSRNFGHQAAIVAGMEHARGNAIVTMDGDLQHPPELIPDLVSAWQAGSEIVQTIRHDPPETGAIKRITSRGFYKTLSSLTQLHVTPGAADFRLMSRVAADAFLACGERRRFNRGLVQWIGFNYQEVPYTASGRHAGHTKYSYRAMLRLASDAIFSFSSWPLRLAGLVGAVISLAAGGYLVFVLWAYFFTARTEPGWSSLLATVLILGGFNLIVLWILGEYVGRMYEEVKQRPIYIVRPSTTPHVAANVPTQPDAAESQRNAQQSSIHPHEH